MLLLLLLCRGKGGKIRDVDFGFHETGSLHVSGVSGYFRGPPKNGKRKNENFKWVGLSVFAGNTAAHTCGFNFL
jgi:hypothetical protein